MELLYLHIKDDKRNIKNCEFNFSPKYRFHYDDTSKTLSLDRGEWLPENWFGENIKNVTAVIGKNGTGKSNLIDSIINTLCGQGGGLAIWSYKGCFYRNKCPFNVASNFQIQELSFWGSPFNDIKNSDRITDSVVVYFSPNIDRKARVKSTLHKYKDISTANFLRRNKRYKNGKYNSYYFSDVDYMQIMDIFRIILFFIYYKDEFLIKDIRIPDFLEITFRSYDVKNGKHPTYIELMKSIDNSFSGQLKSILIKQFFSNDEIPKSWNEETTFDEVLKYFLRNTEERPNIYTELVDLYNCGHILCDLKSQKALSKWDSFGFSIKRTALNIKLMTALFCYYFNQEPAYASFSTLEHNSSIANDGISINWDGLSSGEVSFYTFLARINSELTNYEGEIHIQAQNETKISYRSDHKYFILLLDEPELSFHPEWQQKFIDLLLRFLEKLYPNFMFQIIIASHSPILVSDFPKSNVIFLDKNENGACQVVDSISRDNTFGANIHSLYRNTFFMKGLPIGEFAKRKINKLFNDLEQGKHSTTMLKEIQLIGEPLLRNQLMQLYKEQKDLPQSIDSRIAQLENELKALKNKINDKN